MIKLDRDRTGERNAGISITRPGMENDKMESVRGIISEAYEFYIRHKRRTAWSGSFRRVTFQTRQTPFPRGSKVAAD